MSINNTLGLIEAGKPICYLFEDSTQDIFLAWWQATLWYSQAIDTRAINNIAGEEEGHSNYSSNIFTKKKISPIWTSYYEGATKENGTPTVICKNCSANLHHPNYKSYGTTALFRHLKSNTCLHKKKRKAILGIQKEEVHFEVFISYLIIVIIILIL